MIIIKKVLISIICSITFLLPGCTGKPTDNVITVGNNAASKDYEIALQKEEIHKSLNTRYVEDTNFKIANKPILSLKYNDLIKLWGIPNSMKKVKVYFPATETPCYSYILKYDGIDIEMYPCQVNTPVEDTESFRFDITSNRYDFYGVKLGMKLGDYLKNNENKEVFSVKEILEDTAGERFPQEYRKLLTMLKENNYYAIYDKAIYEQVVIQDVPYGAVVLFKNDVIAMIVYGFPNAS